MGDVRHASPTETGELHTVCSAQLGSELHPTARLQGSIDSQSTASCNAMIPFQYLSNAHPLAT